MPILSNVLVVGNVARMKLYKELTEKQFEVLTQIAFGGESYYHGGKIIDKLKKMGLIVEIGERPIYGKGNTPIDRIPIMIPVYEMPIIEHMGFCKWCSDHPELDREE